MKTICKKSGLEPITPEDLAEYLRIDNFKKEELLSLIKQGREMAENYTRIDFVKRTYEIYFDHAVSFFFAPFSNLSKLEKVYLNKKDGTKEDVTAKYRLYKTESRIQRIEDFDTTDMDKYEGLVFIVEVGMELEEIPETVIGAIRWFAVNTFFKIPANDWLEAFKNLLRPIRLVTV